jgi:hypothetical protein
MKKIFVAPEVFVTELESQNVFAASDDVNGGGESCVWEDDDDVLNILGL